MPSGSAMQADALLGAGGDIAKMRKMSVPALLAVDLKLHDDTLESDSMMWLRTTVDGKVFPTDPRSLLEKAPAKPVILGSNRVEFGVRPEAPRSADRQGVRRARSGSARVLHADQPDPPADPRLGTLDDQIGTDIIFRCPTAMAQILSAKGAPVWRYEFDAAPGGGKTSHAAEIQYAFGDATFAHGLSAEALLAELHLAPATRTAPAWRDGRASRRLSRPMCCSATAGVRRSARFGRKSVRCWTVSDDARAPPLPCNPPWLCRCSQRSGRLPGARLEHVVSRAGLAATSE